MSETITALSAKAIKLMSLKITALEKSIAKINPQLHEEYKSEFEKLKIEHKEEIELLDKYIDAPVSVTVDNQINGGVLLWFILSGGPNPVWAWGYCCNGVSFNWRRLFSKWYISGKT